MFDIEAVGVALRQIRLKIADTEDDSGNPLRERQCEATFRIAVLHYDLASKIRLPIVSHCFGKDRLPLWGVHEVKFHPPEESYLVTLLAAVDMPAPMATLEHAEIIAVKVWRPNKEKREIALEFQTRHEIARGDARDLGDLLQAWEASELHATLTTVQIPIDYGDDPAVAEAAREDAAHGKTGPRRTH